jgi:hypothetical protein
LFGTLWWSIDMLIAQTDPVLMVAVPAAVLALIACLFWVLLNLNRSHKLLIRILDMISELNVAVSRLEQVQQTGNASSAELRKMAGSISKALSRPGLDIDSLLSDMTPAHSQRDTNEPASQDSQNMKI